MDIFHVIFNNCIETPFWGCLYLTNLLLMGSLVVSFLNAAMNWFRITLGLRTWAMESESLGLKAQPYYLLHNATFRYLILLQSGKNTIPTLEDCGLSMERAIIFKEHSLSFHHLLKDTESSPPGSGRHGTWSVLSFLSPYSKICAENFLSLLTLPPPRSLP